MRERLATRLWFLGSLLVAVAATTAVIVVVAGNRPVHSRIIARPAGAASPASSASLTPLQQCATVVTGLLEQVQAAVLAGHPGGINVTAVEERYGVQSAIWQAFFALDAQELADFAQHGVPQGRDPSEVLQVPQACQSYLAP